MNFDIAFERTVGHEGGYTTDDKDRGNWTTGVVGKGQLKGTKYGISAMSYPDEDIAALTIARAKAIYKKDFWDNAGIERFPEGLWFQLFDANVNHGWKATVKLVQRAVGVTADGIVGPNTMAAVGQVKPGSLAMKFLSERLKYFTSLSTFRTYGAGWTNRCANNLGFAAEDN